MARHATKRSFDRSVNVSALARYIGVNRVTLYSWLTGGGSIPEDILPMILKHLELTEAQFKVKFPDIKVSGVRQQLMGVWALTDLPSTATVHMAMQNQQCEVSAELGGLREIINSVEVLRKAGFDIKVTVTTQTTKEF